MVTAIGLVNAAAAVRVVPFVGEGTTLPVGWWLPGFLPGITGARVA